MSLCLWLWALIKEFKSEQYNTSIITPYQPLVESRILTRESEWKINPSLSFDIPSFGKLHLVAKHICLSTTYLSTTFSLEDRP